MQSIEGENGPVGLACEHGGAPARGRDLRRRAVVLAPLLGLLAGGGKASAAPGVSLVPLALPEGINLLRIKPVLELIGRTTSLAWDYQLVPVPRMLAMVENGWTLGFGAGSASTRTSRLLFSEEVFLSGLWPIARGEVERELRSVEDLRGLKVCVVRGLDYGRALEAAKGTLYAAEYVSGDFRTRIRQLMAGRCDVLLANHFNADARVLRQRVAESGGSLERLKVGPAPLGTLPQRFVTAKDSSLAALMPLIDQAVRSHREEIGQMLAGQA